jgi:hypothetical protein
MATTTRAGLTKPDIGSTGWGTVLNTNLDSIDSLFAVLASTNAFTAATSMSATLTMAATIAMGTNKITGLGAGTVAGDALRYEQLIGLYLLLTGGTMSGNIAMGTNKITGLGAGTTNGDALRYEQLINAYMALTGNESIAGIKTFTTQLIGKGTATNDSPAAGYIGEYVSAAASNVSFPATTVYGDAASISLTAGDWDVSYNFQALRNGSTWTVVELGVGTATGNDAAGLAAGDTETNISALATQDNICGGASGIRKSLASTTTLYYKFASTYTVATPKLFGRISARRVR